SEHQLPWPRAAIHRRLISRSPHPKREGAWRSPPFCWQITGAHDRGVWVKAIRVEKPGGADMLRVADVPIPTPGPGQALIKVEAAGVNFIDIYRRSGAYKVSYPFTPGSEAGGTVESVGSGVNTVRQGDRVASS